MVKRTDAYLTVYLTLILAILLSLCLALVEGARRNAAALEAECIVDIGLNSVLAEYHKELFRQYNLFAIDISYGTAMASFSNTERHLQQYLEKNMSLDGVILSNYWYRDFLCLRPEETELTKASLLTDREGGVFRRRAVEAVKDDVGLTLLKELTEWVKTVESNDLEDRRIEEEKQEIDRRLQEYDGLEISADNKIQIVDFQNPTQKLEDKRKQGILKLALGEKAEVSVREISGPPLIMERMRKGEINRGNMVSEGKREESLVDQFLFREYLLNYMGYYGAEKEEGALMYQVEYLIVGDHRDMENLRGTVNRLLLLREGANALYLFSDSEKCMAAELVAAAIASLLLLPEITELLKISLLLGWAYAESLYDVETLLAGGKIPLIKDDATWHYDLQGALQADTQENYQEGTGLAYEDYLRIFLMLSDTDVLTGRAMNMVEADIRQTQGNSCFRLDGCIDGLEARFLIQSTYGYEFEIIRQKEYW